MATPIDFRNLIKTNIESGIEVRPKGLPEVTSSGVNLDPNSPTWESSPIEVGEGEIWGVLNVGIESLSMVANSVWKICAYGSNENGDPLALLNANGFGMGGGNPAFLNNDDDVEIGNIILPVTNAGRNSGKLYPWLVFHLQGISTGTHGIAFNAHFAKMPFWHRS